MNDSFKQDRIVRTRTISPGAPATPKATWTSARILTAIGAAGPILFLAIATLAGLLDPGYDVRTQTVSELALGRHGWLQTTNFFAFGLSIIAFAIGLYRSLRRGSRVGTLLLVVVGGGTFASGLYPTDPQGAPETASGHIHNMLFLVVFFALMLSYIFNALALRKEPGWRAYTWYTALMPLVVFGLTFVFIGFGSDVGDPLYRIGGLIQRAQIAVGFGWITLTARRLLARGAVQ